MQDWNKYFPVWPPIQLSHLGPGLSRDGVDLCEQIMARDPRRRLSATEALNHPYFADIAAENIM